MPKIEEGLKLDFHNVLIRPKRSTINSRSNVNLMRNIKFKNCKSLKMWEGIPIIASNMDTVGTFEVYKTLSKFKAVTFAKSIPDVVVEEGINKSPISDNKPSFELVLLLTSKITSLYFV